MATAPRASGGVPPLFAATQDGGPATAFKDLPPRSEPAIGSTGLPAAAQAEAERAGGSYARSA